MVKQLHQPNGNGTQFLLFHLFDCEHFENCQAFERCEREQHTITIRTKSSDQKFHPNKC